MEVCYRQDKAWTSRFLAAEDRWVSRRCREPPSMAGMTGTWCEAGLHCNRGTSHPVLLHHAALLPPSMQAPAEPILPHP